QLGLLLAVEGGGVVLEILDQGAGLGPLVEDLGLAFIELLALGVHVHSEGRITGGTKGLSGWNCRSDRDNPGRNTKGKAGPLRGKGWWPSLAEAGPGDKPWPGANPAICDNDFCCVRARAGYRPPCAPSRGPRQEHLTPMTTFDDREKGFESKYALDQEQEFKV